MNTQISTAPASAGPLSRFDSLLRATDAFRNIRALALLGITVLAAALTMAIFAWLGAKAGLWLTGVGSLLSFVIFFYGVNAVGILLMDEAQGKTGSSIRDAVLLSLFSSHRLIGVAILQMLIVLLAIAAVAIILVICKIPFLGPLLFTFVYPITAILLGLLVFSLFYVMFPLAGPAVWSGATVFQVIARLQVIGTRKLVSVILSQLILFMIVGFASGVIFLVVGVGLALTTSISAPIVGGGDDGMMTLISLAIGLFSGHGSYGGGMGDGMSGTGHMAAGAIGGGLLFAAAAVIPMLMLTKGFCLIYLNATADLDFSRAEGNLEGRIGEMKKKADQARERARELAERQRGSAADPVPVTAGMGADNGEAPVGKTLAPPAPSAVASTCIGCLAPLENNAAFCGECGRKVE